MVPSEIRARILVPLTRKAILSPGLLVLALTILACAAGAEGSGPVVVEKEVIKEVPIEGVKEVPKDVVVQQDVVKQAIADTSRSASGPHQVPGPDGPDIVSKIQPSMVAQNRIIIHTGDMTLVVDDVAGAVDRVTALAREFGGWVVSSDRSSRHSGSVSIRVPAQSLQGVIKRLEGLALDVETLALTSQDVTDEFVDSQSRLTGLRVTEQVHLDMLSRAVNVEEALLVQDRISDIQVQIEELQGRINYLSEIAAFSLINVNLRLSTVSMPIDAGPDAAFRVGQNARFTANVDPPPGVDDFSFTWDFGEGTTGKGSRTAPVASVQGQRVTDSLYHAYAVEGDYIAEVKMVGRGDTGLAEGSDTVIVTVTQVPFIEVFAGEDLVVEEGDDLGLRATFTRPSELWDYESRWDFGDGTPTEIGIPEESVTRVETVHKFNDYRPDAYPVTFTMSAMSEAGKVSTSGHFKVSVTESRGFIIGGWSAGETGKTAVRALSVVGQGLATIVIWLAVFSPVWLFVAVVVIGVIYVRRRFGNRDDPRRYLEGVRGRQAEEGEFYDGLESYGREALENEAPDAAGVETPSDEEPDKPPDDHRTS